MLSLLPGMMVSSFLQLDGIQPTMVGRRTPWLEGKVIVVGALAPNKQIAPCSNFDADRVDLLAPGGQLYYKSGESTVELIGTSFAAPFVTLVAGLLRSIGIKSPQEIRRRLIAASDFDLQLWWRGIGNVDSMPGYVTKFRPRS